VADLVRQIFLLHGHSADILPATIASQGYTIE
jgi:hypothetical protein